MLIFFNLVSGRFDTSGSMIPDSVSKILALDGFCDEKELGILVYS